MKIKNSTITFWFRKQSNLKQYVDNLNQLLKDYFFEFNTIAVPVNIDPAIARLNAASTGSHSKLEVSLINARLNTNFDDNYCNDSQACISYLKERVLKIFDALINCGINVIFSAIFINVEEKEPNAAGIIKNYFMKEDDIKNIGEIGIRLSEEIDGKFYRNISFGNAKQIKIDKTFENNEKAEIIIPLISLNEASEIEEYLNTTLEINDKLAFNLNSDYNTTKDDLEKMFDMVLKQLSNEMKRFETITEK